MLSQHPWRKDNSFGNTYSNIFGKMEGVEIAHIFLLDGQPEYEPNVKRYYQIRENDVIKTFFSSRKQNSIGEEVYVSKDNVQLARNETIGTASIYGKLLSFGKRHHWMSLFWAREFAWKYGNINYEGLLEFVRDFKPDIFFLPFENVYNTNRLAIYIKDRYNVPMVAYMAMDHYSLKRISFNPLFWVDRFFKRSMIRNLTKRLEKWFVISDKLKVELDRDLYVNSQILYKIPEEERGSIEYHSQRDTPIFLFTGNIYANRWKSLKLLAQALKSNDFGHLDIYTASPVTAAINKALNVEHYSEIHNPVSQDEVIKLQNNADVLVHVEAFDLYNKLLVRCAISTKIMDYLSAGRCIMAIGPRDVASIEYLKERNLAFVANDSKEVNKIISEIKSDNKVLFDYSKRVMSYVKKKLDAKSLRQTLFDGLETIINHYNRQ